MTGPVSGATSRQEASLVKVIGIFDIKPREIIRVVLFRPLKYFPG